MANLVSGKDLKTFNYAPSWKNLQSINSNMITVAAGLTDTVDITLPYNKTRVKIYFWVNNTSTTAGDNVWGNIYLIDTVNAISKYISGYIQVYSETNLKERFCYIEFIADESFDTLRIYFSNNSGADGRYIYNIVFEEIE